MNYLPLLGFLVAVAWIVRQGYVAKKKYIETHKSHQDLPQGREQSTEANLKAESYGQGRKPDPSELAGPGRQRETHPTWN